MNEIFIRLTDSDLVGQIEKLARHHNVSPELEADSLLRQAVQQQLRGMSRVERAKAIAAMTPAGVKQTDSVRLIREIRDSEVP